MTNPHISAAIETVRNLHVSSRSEVPGTTGTFESRGAMTDEVYAAAGEWTHRVADGVVHDGPVATRRIARDRETSSHSRRRTGVTGSPPRVSRSVPAKSTGQWRRLEDPVPGPATPDAYSIRHELLLDLVISSQPDANASPLPRTVRRWSCRGWSSRARKLARRVRMEAR